eukprot:IDg5277t1
MSFQLLQLEDTLCATSKPTPQTYFSTPDYIKKHFKEQYDSAQNSGMALRLAYKNGNAEMARALHHGNFKKSAAQESSIADSSASPRVNYKAKNAVLKKKIADLEIEIEELRSLLTSYEATDDEQ